MNVPQNSIKFLRLQKEIVEREEGIHGRTSIVAIKSNYRSPFPQERR